MRGIAPSWSPTEAPDSPQMEMPVVVPGAGTAAGTAAAGPTIAPVEITAIPTIKDGLCDEVAVSADPVKPAMLIMLDRSGSMVMQGRWEPSVQAIRTVVERLQDRIAFGLALFPDAAASSGFGGDPCAAGGVVVPTATMNAAAIGTALDRATPDTGWTPTADSLNRILREFVMTIPVPDQVEPEKFILFVTDGQPNCGLTDILNRSVSLPQDVQASNAAIEALTAAGAKTYVIGYKGMEAPVVDAGMPADMAAAVPPPLGAVPPAPAWEQLAPILDGFAQRGGTGDTMHRPVDDAESLVAEFERISQVVIPCVYALDQMPADPSYVRVTLDSIQLMLNQPDGWVLVEGRNVELVGNACATLKDGQSHQLKVDVTCEPVR